ncbi:MAG: hypothetical protein HQ592_15840 [Planctomycetes bacterium]|nr:hypothetical protein [Planctomycetota bacterium]
MEKERTTEGNIGRITSGITLRALALATISFVQDRLSAWRDDPDRPDEDSENKLNLQLCKFLDSCARKDFVMVRFDHEEYQLGRSAVDLSASPAQKTVIGAIPHTIYDPFLVLEGKRLPAPSRKKEYVTGGKHMTGGIQRFKLGRHGADFSLAAMIGYVQKKTARHWHDEINKWISELASAVQTEECQWSDGEALKQFEEDLPNGVSQCHSCHSRTTSKSSIELHHLWVQMNRRVQA